MPQEIKCPTSDPAIHNQKRVTGGSRSHKKKGMDELKHKLFNPPSKSNGPSSINHNNVSEISETACPRKVIYDSIDEASQYLAQLYDKAIDAEDRQIELIRKKFYVGASTRRISEISLMKLSEAIVVNLVKRRREKKLLEVNVPSISQIIPAKANDNNLTDLKEEDFCGGE
ncbi:10909_t:CDS:2, partial [Racocetra persica]